MTAHRAQGQKLPMIGKDLNVVAYSRQVIDKWHKLDCWYLYASGHIVRNRSRSRTAVKKVLARFGFPEEAQENFVNGCIATLKLEQNALEAK